MAPGNDVISLIIALIIGMPALGCRLFVLAKTVAPVYYREARRILVTAGENSTKMEQRGKSPHCQYIAGRKCEKELTVIKAVGKRQKLSAGSDFQPTTIVSALMMPIFEPIFCRWRQNQRRYPWALLAIDGNGF